MMPVQNTNSITSQAGDRQKPQQRVPDHGRSSLSRMLLMAVAIFNIKNLTEVFSVRIDARPVMVPVRAGNGFSYPKTKI